MLCAESKVAATLCISLTISSLNIASVEDDFSGATTEALALAIGMSIFTVFISEALIFRVSQKATHMAFFSLKIKKSDDLRHSNF